MRFLSKKQVRDLIGIGPTRIARLEKAGKFPQRVTIGFQVFWIEDEVLDWMNERLTREKATMSGLTRGVFRLSAIIIFLAGIIMAIAGVIVYARPDVAMHFTHLQPSQILGIWLFLVAMVGIVLVGILETLFAIEGHLRND